MFEFIIGDIVNIKEDYIVLQNNKIGYKIFTSVNSIMSLEIGMKEAMIYTYLNVRDDGLYLYGFTSQEEMKMYKMLLLVSRVGPKVALGILSSFNPNQIKVAILSKDITTLCKAPGIGKKTAERIILELKDRINKEEVLADEGTNLDISNNYHEAINGLMSLGYTRMEVEKSISNVDTSDMDIEEIIRKSLKKLSKQ